MNRIFWLVYNTRYSRDNSVLWTNEKPRFTKRVLASTESVGRIHISWVRNKELFNAEKQKVWATKFFRYLLQFLPANRYVLPFFGKIFENCLLKTLLQEKYKQVRFLSLLNRNRKPHILTFDQKQKYFSKV